MAFVPLSAGLELEFPSICWLSQASSEWLETGEFQYSSIPVFQFLFQFQAGGQRNAVAWRSAFSIPTSVNCVTVNGIPVFLSKEF
ncbi:hypothetical protein CDEST_06252 [Colletotrichum destructivum]|uniref:Uncharacterized protein n=1 Tax=Colletotrichum destructivum TaxID=34406 RepID=A0AAX4IE52_9PEZI|nr:hypothetical protein CDEST_06252 [Colletotrichum destructivum]